MVAGPVQLRGHYTTTGKKGNADDECCHLLATNGRLVGPNGPIWVTFIAAAAARQPQPGGRDRKNKFIKNN
jgi:hypothetical protein